MLTEISLTRLSGRFAPIFYFNCEHSMRSGKVHNKIGSRSVQPFWRLLDTNKQTDKQTSEVWKFNKDEIEKKGH